MSETPVVDKLQGKSFWGYNLFRKRVRNIVKSSAPTPMATRATKDAEFLAALEVTMNEISRELGAKAVERKPIRDIDCLLFEFLGDWLTKQRGEL